MPPIATEGSARQRILHDVEEFAVGTIEFNFSIMKQVVSCADAWSNFLAEAEADRRSTRPIRRQEFLINPDSGVDGEPLDRPAVLTVNGMVQCGNVSVCQNTVAQDVITIRSGTLAVFGDH